jgi:hypothetical protein
MITEEGVQGVTGGHFHMPYIFLNEDPAKTVEAVSIDARKRDIKWVPPFLRQFIG